MLRAEILGAETFGPGYADLCIPVVCVFRTHSVSALRTNIFITCSRCTFCGTHNDRMLRYVPGFSSFLSHW